MTGMDRTSLKGLAHKLLDFAAAGPAGRSASTVYGGREQVLRQTLIALTAGISLSEHENPGEGTVLVLLGRVRLLAGVASWDGTESPIELFERMDEALYAAKAAGRDLAMLAPPSSRPRLRAVRVA